jgi:nitrate/TMAO reductase-like tetraheme cytochrome c subunit
MSDKEPEVVVEGKEPEPISPSVFRNYISYVGIAIAIGSFTSILLLILLSLTGRNENPYTDLITFIFVPSILVFGIFLALVGAILERRRRRRDPEAKIKPFPVVDLNDPRRRRSVLVFLVLLFAFLFISAFGSYRAFEYTESVTFCGQACHNVMKPEFVAYQASPHAEIRCVECHVGGGAEAYVKAKFNGMHQLWGVVTGHYDRPVKTPVFNMRSATETCQKCHWAQKYHGDELRVFNHYGFDENNTMNQTRMMVHVGGGDPITGPSNGIHWHMNIANEVTYVATDDRRQVIPYVRFKDANGNVTEYTSKFAEQSPQQLAQMPKRTMDCIDCHSRPAHVYLSPNAALDRALDAGRLDISLPYIKAKGAEVLSKEYSTEEEARQTIANDLDNYYRSTYPDLYASKGDVIKANIAQVQKIYSTYFFPEMKTDWSSHYNNIGHFNAQGCFRCHDGQHFSPEGKVIRNDCNICHTTIDQTFKGQTIKSENGEFQHPVNLGDKNTWQCAACHKADRSFKHPVNLGDISKFQCVECHNGKFPKLPGY